MTDTLLRGGQLGPAAHGFAAIGQEPFEEALLTGRKIVRGPFGDPLREARLLPVPALDVAAATLDDMWLEQRAIKVELLRQVELRVQ